MRGDRIMDLKNIFEGEKYETYCLCEKELRNNPTNLRAIGSLVEYLQHYVFDEYGDYEEELINSKITAATLTLQIIEGIKNNKYLYPEYLLIVAQNKFIIGDIWGASKCYEILLKQPTVLDLSWAKKKEHYAGEQEDAAKIIHNLCVCYELLGLKEKSKKIKEKYKYVFELEFLRHKRLAENNPSLRDSFEKEYNELNGKSDTTFYLGDLVSSPFFEYKHNMLEAIYEDAKENKSACDVKLFGKLQVEESGCDLVLRKAEAFHMFCDTIVMTIDSYKVRNTFEKTRTNFEDEKQWGYEDINFNGMNITVPSAELIRDYLAKMKCVRESYEIIDGIIQKQVKECKLKGNDAWSWIQTYFWADIFDRDENGRLILAVLSAIEDVAIDICQPGEDYDIYGRETKAYQSIEKLRSILVHEAKEINIAYERNYEAGSRNAYHNAVTQIKGMPYGIVTNSAIDLIAYNAVSNMTIKAQARKADKQYTEEIKKIAKSTGDIYKSQLLNLMFEQYVPTMRSLIKLWTNEISENIINYEEQHNNNPVFREISKFDIEKSMDICKDAEKNECIDNVKLKLLEAITICPYNEETYIIATKKGLMNKDLYAYAERFTTTNSELCLRIKNEIIQICRGKLQDIADIKKHISFLTSFENERHSIIFDIYSEHLAMVRKGYGRLKKILMGCDPIKLYVEEILGVSTPEEFLTMSDEELGKRVEMNVLSYTNETIMTILNENKLIEYSEIAINNETGYDNINEGYCEKMKSLLKDYRQSLNVEKKIIDKKQLDYDSKIKQSEDRQEEMFERLSKFRFFERRKKKELQQDLNLEQRKCEELKREQQQILFDWI